MGLVSSRSISLSARQSFHFDVTSDLLETEVAVITGSGAANVLAKSTIYYYRSDMKVSTAYTIEAGAALDSSVESAYNTFLNQSNWLRLHNISATPQMISIEAFTADGFSLGVQMPTLPANQGFDFDLVSLFSLPPSSIGRFTVSTSSPGVLYGDLIRVQHGATVADVEEVISVELQ